jgi:hypothetical protein
MSCLRSLRLDASMYLLHPLLAKTIELDMKIPFISKLKRYTKLDNAVTEFKLAEQHLLKHFNWLFSLTYQIGTYNNVH